MKQSYIVSKEDDYDVARGCPTYSVVRKFRNEPEAIAFYEEPKNHRLHGPLYLNKRDAEGNTLEWNAATHSWE